MKARKFELKELRDGMFKYRDMLTAVITNPEPGGTRIDEQRKRIKLLDKIESANGHILFATEEWEDLKKRVNAFPWGMVAHEIVRFCDDLEAAPEVELKEA